MVEQFVRSMRGLGYTVRFGPNVKYMTVTAPGVDRARRVYKLGSEYTEEAIRQRIAGNTPEQVNSAIRESRNDAVASVSALARVRYARPRRTHKKLKGLQARYFRILYTFGMIRKYPRQAGNREMYNMMYDQVRQLDSYIRQMNLLRNLNITTMEGLNQYKENIEQQIGDLARQRSGLYRNLRSGENCQASIDGLSAQLKSLRQTLRDCVAIQERSEETLRRIRETERQKDEKERERGSCGLQW